MPSIASDGVAQIPGLVKKFETMGAPMEGISKALREHLLETDQILKIDDASDLIPQVSLATIDGGSVLDQLSFADMVVTGAAIGEGRASKKLYLSDAEYPVLTYASVVQHQWKNSSMLAPGLMASQELSLQGHIKHNIKIIDGSWTSGLTAMMLASLQHEQASLAILDSALGQRARDGWDGFEALRAVDRITSPWRYRNADFEVIALSKSDSSMVWSQRIRRSLGKTSDIFKNLELTDRNLAGLVLEPGEMLSPTYVDAGRSLSPRLSAEETRSAKIRKVARWLTRNLTEQEQIRYGVDSVAQLPKAEQESRSSFITAFVSQLLDTGYQDSALPEEHRTPQQRIAELDSHPGGSWVWSSYFLPNDFDPNHRPLRMEFTRDWSDWDEQNRGNDYGDYDDDQVYYDTHISADPLLGYGDIVIPKAKHLVSLVNQDIVSAEISEPWSQYAADQNAKQVSALAQRVKSELISSVKDERLRMGLLRNYRT